jgi:subtilase family serine protease
MISKYMYRSNLLNKTNNSVMRVSSVLTTLVSIMSTASARSTGLTPKAAASSPLEVFESVYETPQGWTRHERVSSSTPLHLRIALEMPNHALFEETLYSISTPDHPSYGNHLSHEEVKRLVQPRDSSVEGVMYWLQSSGVEQTSIEKNGDWIIFKSTVGVIVSTIRCLYS